MTTRSNYIASPDHLKQIYTRHAEWSAVDKVPVSRIRIDARLFSFPNPVYQDAVKAIVESFDLDQWTPLLVNEDLYLLDGQHRLQAAVNMGLKYIDVIVQHVEHYSYYYGRPVKTFI